MGDELKWALQNGDMEKVQSIIGQNSSRATEKIGGRPPLCIAADYGQVEAIEYLVNQGADINEADQYGITPLLSAIYEDHSKCVTLLLAKGASKDGKAPDGSSYVECAPSDDIKSLLQ